MKKLKLMLLVIVASFVFYSCSSEDNDATIETEITSSLTIDNERKTDEFGWQCSSTMGLFYHMDLYNEGIPVSDQCRYLHIYDPNAEDDNNEFLHIGYWAIAPNATTVYNIGLDGLHSCKFSIPNRDCSLLEDNTIYYYELSYFETGYPIINSSSYGWIQPYNGECQCD